MVNLAKQSAFAFRIACTISKGEKLRRSKGRGKTSVQINILFPVWHPARREEVGNFTLLLSLCNRMKRMATNYSCRSRGYKKSKQEIPLTPHGKMFVCSIPTWQWLTCRTSIYIVWIPCKYIQGGEMQIVVDGPYVIIIYGTSTHYFVITLKGARLNWIWK